MFAPGSGLGWVAGGGEGRDGAGEGAGAGAGAGGANGVVARGEGGAGCCGGGSGDDAGARSGLVTGGGVCAYGAGTWGVIIGSGIGSLDDGVVVAGMSPRSDAAVGAVRWIRVGVRGHVGDFGAAGCPARE